MEEMSRMRRQMTAIETIREFCRVWFEERDWKKTVEYLTEDVTFVGTGEHESARGKEAMAAYLREDILEIPEPFGLDFTVIHQQPIREDVVSLSFEIVLKNTVYMWRLRCFFTLVKEAEGVWEIASLHFAEPGNSQQGDEHYPQTLVIQNTVRQRQELLNDSLPGGMMGGYIEDGFPFYIYQPPDAVLPGL